MATLRKSRSWLILVTVLVGCEGLGDGCGGASGCDTTIETDGLRIGTDVGFPPAEALSNVAGLTITDDGFSVVEEQGLAIIGELLGVSPDNLDLSDLVTDYLDENPIELFNWSLRDVELIASLPDGNDSIRLTVLNDPPRLRIAISELWISASATVFGPVGIGDAACNIGPDADVGGGEPQSLVFEDITIDVILETTSEGQLNLSTDIINLGLVDTGIGVVTDEDDPAYYCNIFECTDGCSECVLFCEGGDLLLDLGEFLAGLLSDLVGELAEMVVNGILDGVKAVEGELHPALLLGNLAPTMHDAEWLQFRLSPGSEGFAALPIPEVDPSVANDLFLSFAGGTYADLHPCVVKTEGEPVWSPPGGYQLVAGETRPHLVLSLADTFIDQALWSVYKAGALCLSVDSAGVSSLTGELDLNVGLLSLLLPGLDRVAEPEAPLLVTLRPNIAHDDFPLVSLGDPGADESLIGLVLGSVDIGLYAWVQGRFLQLFEVRTRVDLGFTPMVLPDNELQLTIDSLNAALESELYNELFQGVDLTDLVNFVLELATGLVADGGLDLSFSLDDLLSDLFGLPLRLVIDRLGPGGPEGRWIELAVRLDDTSSTAAMRLVDTDVLIEQAGPGWVDLAVTAPGFAAEQIEYQVRWGFGAWSGFRPATAHRVETTFLRLPGARTIEVRARAIGDYRSLDSSPYVGTIEVVESGLVEPRALEDPEPGVPLSGCSQSGQARPPSWLLGVFLVFLLGSWRSCAERRPSPPNGPCGLFGQAERAESSRQRAVDSREVDSKAIDSRQSVALSPTALLSSALCLLCSVDCSQLSALCPKDPKSEGNTSKPQASRGLLILAALALALSPLLGACGDDGPSQTRLSCTASRDCPGGQFCGCGGVCVTPQPCDSSAECCANEVCSDGLCLNVGACESELDCAGGLACEGCACVPRDCRDDDDCWDGELCEGGVCLPDDEAPCQGECGPIEVCSPIADACLPRPAACADIQCDPGATLIIAGVEEHLGPSCQLEPDCVCTSGRAVPTGDIGTEISVVSLGGSRFVVLAHDHYYGDLVAVRFNGDALLGLPEYIDGLPNDSAGSSPGVLRGGVFAAGPARGAMPDAAVLGAQIAAVYQDVDAQSLRFAREIGSGEWETSTIDPEAGSGWYPELETTADGRWVVAYLVRRGEVSELRLAVSSSSAPLGPNDWQINTVDIGEGVVAAGESVPAAIATHPSLVVDGATATIAYFDSVDAELRVARGDLAGPFTVSVLDPGPTRSGIPDSADVGLFPSLARAPGGSLGLAFVDRISGEVVYGELSEGEDADTLVFADLLEVVDPGRRQSPPARVGADLQLSYDASGTALAVYQDSSGGDLMVSVRAEFDWQRTPVLRTGVAGFSPHLFVDSDPFWVVHGVLSDDGGGDLIESIDVRQLPDL